MHGNEVDRFNLFLRHALSTSDIRKNGRFNLPYLAADSGDDETTLIAPILSA